MRRDRSPLASAAKWRGIGSLLLFLALFAVLQAFWNESRGTTLERAIIHGATVGTATILINLVTPQVKAQADGTRIRAQGGGLNILNGCEGVEVMLLLVAAIATFPVSLRSRLAGIVFGILFVFALNLIRILALFYAYRADKELFSLLHGTVAPVLLIALSVFFLAAWKNIGAGSTATGK